MKPQLIVSYPNMSDITNIAQDKTVEIFSKFLITHEVTGQACL